MLFFQFVKIINKEIGIEISDRLSIINFLSVFPSEHMFAFKVAYFL